MSRSESSSGSDETTSLQPQQDSSQDSQQDSSQDSAYHEDHDEDAESVSVASAEKPRLWGCQSDPLSRLSDAEAIERLQHKQALEQCEIEQLDLSGRIWEHPVVIRDCRIHRLVCEGAVFHQSVLLERVTLVQEARISGSNYKDHIRQTVFHQPVTWHHVRCDGAWVCEAATFHQKMSCLAQFNAHCSWSFCQWNQELVLNACEFQEELQIVQATVRGVAWMCGITCHKQATFRRVVFQQKMNARESVFSDHLYFTHIQFQQRAGFNKILCKGQADWDGSQFHGEFSSKGSTFAGRVSFRSCVGHVRMALHNSTFAQQLALSRLHLHGDWIAPTVHFGGRVILDHARIQGTIDLRASTISGDFFCRKAVLGTPESTIHWEQTRFAKDVDCEGTLFAHQLLCNQAVFSGKTSFVHATLGNKDGMASFEHAVFHRRTHFLNAIFPGVCRFSHAVFQQKTVFSRCTFQQLAVFSDVTFQEHLSFLDAQFEHKAFFFRSSFQDADFSGAEFQGAACFSAERSTQPDEIPATCVFHGQWLCEGTRFLKKALFQYVRVEGTASFKYAYFGEQVSFRYTTFGADAIFAGTFCDLELDLRRAQVAKELQLKGASVNRRVNLADAVFSQISFYNLVTDLLAVTPAQITGRLRGEQLEQADPVALDRTAHEYLLLKKSFSSQGMYDDEDWAYWQFRRYSRIASSVQAKGEKNYKQLFKNGLERVFLDYGSSYGTHPLRITLLAGALILLFGVFYWMFPDQIILEGKEIVSGQKINFNQSIYFSIMAFTTMGFGDVHPDFHGWIKGVVALEALVGIITMTLFVGTYARKIIR